MYNKKFNILMAAEVFAPDHLGGAGRWCHEVAKCLVRRGHTITLVIRRSKSDLPSQETIDGIRVFRYGNTKKKSWLGGLLYYLQGRNLVKALWKQETFNFSHIHQPFSGLITLHGSPKNISMVYCYYSPWHQEYLVDHIKGTSPGISLGYWARFAIERWVIRHCQRIIVLSDYSLGQVNHYHNLKKMCIKIPGGIDIERFSPAVSKSQTRNELVIPPCSLLLFTVRNLRQRMGLLQLLDAMNVLKNKIPDIHLFIAGKGPLKSELENTVEESQLQSNVTLLGEVAEEKLPLYYQAADLFVLPTQQLEGFGLVTLEALASGTPVIATPVGANVEVLGGLDERLLASGAEAQDLAKTILTFYQEPEKRIDSRTCRDFAEKFSWQSVAEQVENCYRDLIK